MTSKLFLIFIFILLLATVLVKVIAEADVGIIRALDKQPIKVLVIDTGLYYQHPVFKKYNIMCQDKTDCTDLVGHGTHVSSLVLNGELTPKFKASSPVCDNVKLYSCSYNLNMVGMFRCLQYALAIKPDFINFSSTGDLPIRHEYEMIKYLTNNGTVFVTAAGNDHRNIAELKNFPAGYLYSFSFDDSIYSSLSNLYAVGATSDVGAPIKESNYGLVVWMKGLKVLSAFKNGYAYATGTSMATALYTHQLILQKCRELNANR